MGITLLSMKILSIRVTLSWKCWGPSEAQGWGSKASGFIYAAYGTRQPFRGELFIGF